MKKLQSEWSIGFLDGLTCAVEILGTTGNEGAARNVLQESNMGKEIVANSKNKNPHFYKQLKEYGVIN